MTPLDPRIVRYLDAIKAEGRSSPAGMHWHSFHEFLLTKTQPDQDQSPKPLILAASGEPESVKHSRLKSQLAWAQSNGCLEEALQYLGKIPSDNWNCAPLDRWNESYY